MTLFFFNRKGRDPMIIGTLVWDDRDDLYDIFIHQHERPTTMLTTNKILQ